MSLIPKDKGDIETAEKLKNYSYENVKEIIPNLLEWLQDMNWPVSNPVSKYLLTFKEEIVPEILEIFKSDDEIWKYWIIWVFGPHTESILIKKEIMRIITSPTSNEIREEVNKIASEIAEKRGWIKKNCT